MSPENQQIAIAEACGWFNYAFAWVNSDGRETWELPDYLNDLNAMHEAEKALLGPERRKPDGRLITTMQSFKYTETLSKITGNLPMDDFDIFRIAHATAAQRAEAFLRTIGKWEE